MGICVFFKLETESSLGNKYMNQQNTRRNKYTVHKLIISIN